MQENMGGFVFNLGVGLSSYVSKSRFNERKIDNFYYIKKTLQNGKKNPKKPKPTVKVKNRYHVSPDLMY